MEKNNNLIDTLNMLKSCESNLINFSLRTEDIRTKETYFDMIDNIKEVENKLRNIIDKAKDQWAQSLDDINLENSVIVVDGDDVIPPSKLPEM